jgi:hypothetical protein
VEENASGTGNSVAGFATGNRQWPIVNARITNPQSSLSQSSIANSPIVNLQSAIDN